MSMLSRRIFVQDGFKVVSLGLAMPHVFTRAVQAADRKPGATTACCALRRTPPTTPWPTAP